MKRLIQAAMLLLPAFALPLTESSAQSPPGDLGLRSKFVQLTTGVRMHYVEGGRHRGKVIIFVHGYTDSWRSFERNLPLAGDKFRVLAIDQRGHGDSSKPACCYRASDFSADLAAFMDALKIRRATIVGHSMGSLNAHKFAIDYPSRVERLVLVGSATTLAGNPNVRPLYTETVRFMTDPLAPGRVEFVREFQRSTFAGENGVSDEFLSTAVSESLKVPATVWKQALAEMLVEDHSAQLPRITAPTLILYGARDGIFFLEDNRRLASLIPRARLKVYYRETDFPFRGFPGHTGHGLHVEWPREFARDLEAFAR